MADGVIDSLSIEIGASSTKAVQNINKLVKSLEKLKAVTSSGFSLGNFKNELGKIGNTEYAKIDKLAKALQGLKGVSVSSRLGNDIANIAAGLDLIETKHIDRLQRFGSAMGNLKSVSTRGYDTLPASLLNIATAVDSITDASIMRIHRLTLALSRLRGVDLSGLAAVLNAQRRNALGGGSGGAGNGNSGGGGNSGNGGVRNFGSSSQRQTTGYQSNSFVSNLASAAKHAAKITANIAKWTFRTAVNAVKKLVNGIKSFAKGVANAGKKFLSWGAKQLGLTRLEDDFKRIQKLISSFGRVALYRAIRSAIKYVTDALKEGTENAYQFSKQFGDATHYISEAYDQLASSNFKMSNQLGAAWSTLIATIQPILLQIIDLVTRAANAVTQFFAVLGGKTTYMKALDYSKDWADTTASGAASAKEWKNQLMGFDEINRLEEPSDSSGGGGSSSPDYSKMFEESPVGELIKEIRDLWNGGEFEKLGTLLGSKFNDMVNSIDWAGIGRKIGYNLNGVIVTAYHFLKEADFKNLGRRIAESLNNMADEIDFNKLGRLFMRVRTVIWDVLYGATVGLEWKDVAFNLSDFILGALQETVDWLNTLDPKEVAKAIKDFFGNIKYGEIRDTFKELISTAWEKAVELKEELFPEGLVATVTQSIVDFFGEISWEDIKNKIQEGLATIRDTFTTILDIIWPAEDRESFKGVLSNEFFSLIAKALDKIDVAGLHNVFSYCLDRVIWGEDRANKTWNKKGEYAGRDIISGISGGIVSTSDQIQTDWDMYVKNPTQDNLDALIKKIEDDCDAAAGDLDSLLIEIGGSVSDEMGNIGNSINSVSDAMQSMDNSGNSAMSNMSRSVSSNGSSIISKMNAIREAASRAWNWLYKVNSSGGVSMFGGHLTIGRQYATGGFPEDGLFMANHGELVGKFSNGRTAVANNEQITEGIADAVYSAFMSAFSQTSGNGESRESREISLNVNGKEFARAIYSDIQSVAREKGISLINGRGAVA